ncbi:MAG: glutamate racemase, partial [Anaerovorax sp.]
NKIDTLVLGCTHYPLIRDNISKLYPHLQIIDPSKEILQSITDSLGENHLLSDAPTFENTFYASDLSENFVNMINKIFENSNLDISFKIGKIQL